MVTCPHCKQTFNIDIDISKGDYDGMTADCPQCDGLVMIENGKFVVPYWFKENQKTCDYVELPLYDN